MLLEISFTEVNKLLAAQGMPWLQLSSKGDDLIVSARSVRLKIQQIDSKINQSIFSHKGDSLTGKLLSTFAFLGKSKLPPYVGMDFSHITIYWDKLLPHITILKSQISVRGQVLQVSLDI